MGVEASAYAVLGLEPGADRTAVDAAYRRLIKRYHPDRSGGDADRAAEINRAYFELRRKRAPDEPSPPAAGDIAQAIYARRASRSRAEPPKRRRRKVWPYLAAAVAALLFIERERVMDAVPLLRDALSEPWRPVVASAPGSAPAGAITPLDGPLAERSIRRSIRDAARLTGTASQEGAAEASRVCHRAMRADPGTAQLDRCASFDYAVTLLLTGDLATDQGAFSASAVTARQMAAASLLSNDFLEIEARLDRIRNRVELALAPGEPSASGGAQTAP